MRPPLDPLDAGADPTTDATADSPYVRSLDGRWDFQLHANPAAAAAGGETAAWGRIDVPGSWVLPSTANRGTPIYTNVIMPFVAEPPAVPDDNPTGVYRRRFRVPRAWRQRRVLLEIGSADSTVEDIERAYIEGWRLGLKALAIYRDGSKSSQPPGLRKSGASLVSRPTMLSPNAPPSKARRGSKRAISSGMVSTLADEI